MSYVPLTEIASAINGTHYTSIPIGGDRVITSGSDGQLAYADSSSIEDCYKILGISVGATAAEQSFSIQNSGIREDSTWNWLLGEPIYLGSNGILTQTIPTRPTSYFSLIVAFPITHTKIFINIKEPILLG